MFRGPLVCQIMIVFTCVNLGFEQRFLDMVSLMNLRRVLLSPNFCYMTLESILDKTKMVRRPLVLRNHNCLACVNWEFEQDFF